MMRNKLFRKPTAVLLMVALLTEIIYPIRTLALTTGPTQPEVLSFEPVGTTDMVNLFSGDFVYNIPLFDVEGYPVNLSYHGGITMEQEASWVGLGWNINPGTINRSVRGVPDDFNGEPIGRQLHIKDEKTIRGGVGGGWEHIGKGDPNKKPSLDLGAYITWNNYRGYSCDISLGLGMNVFPGMSTGINFNIGSQTGADIDPYVNYQYNTKAFTSSFLNKDIALGAYGGVGVTGGYNTRTGIKDHYVNLSAGLSITAPAYTPSDLKKKRSERSFSRYATSTPGISESIRIPIGLTNYVPVITNSSTMKTIFGRIKVGGELFWNLKYLKVSGMYSKIHFENDGTKPSFGYLYLQNADTNSILDFTRDKDGMFNETMQFLPPATLTYDVYSLTGQGTYGQFRPYRNDIGSVYDPNMDSHNKTNSYGLEGSIPSNIFELGIDYARMKTMISSGSWSKYRKDFTPNQSGSMYENVYFRAAGELTSTASAYASSYGGPSTPVSPAAAVAAPKRKPGATASRDPRGNLIYYNTGAKAVTGDIYNYTNPNFTDGASPDRSVISRTASPRNGHQISEIVQLQKDGRRYCYGIPAMNNYTKEATFSVDPLYLGISNDGLVPYDAGVDDGMSNNKGIDNYFSSSSTAAHAHSYLLTSVLSTDYEDVLGDGVTDDDLGSFTKLNYTLAESAYEWRTPYQAGYAQYNPGFYSEPRDDKGIYVQGSREQWYLHSVESKNYISEFYTSTRHDGKGSNGANSSKLDSVKLYNKHDRYINGSNAVPIKSVYFVYDYSLCSGVPNSSMIGGGKLTLKRLYFKYGNSQKSLISPYTFNYGFNPSYDAMQKNRWGDYKPVGSFMNNFEFPYVDQNDTLNNLYASAWSLSSIGLPSGGSINVEYEADDYASVQNIQPMEMFPIKGMGTGPEYNKGCQLYYDKHMPVLFAYFKRRISSELPWAPFESNYIIDKELVYYNFNVKLAEKEKTHEQIKGYASIEKIGECSDGIHGYIKFKPVKLKGSGVNMNPIAFTALNVGKYNLPQILYPGSDPDESSAKNMWNGLKAAFMELITAYKNPLVRMIKKGQGKDVKLSRSYVRLLCPGMSKKGGGHRVKRMLFYDNWNTLVGGNEPNAAYGKVYSYGGEMKVGDVIRPVSYGVASYEPLNGGDENPFRKPVKYTAKKGNSFPPYNSTDLYQEEPICESFYPPATVGYSQVSVTSIHADVGKSAQGVDVYQFYTAKDFPVKFRYTPIDIYKDKYVVNIFRKEKEFEATQAYSLELNDMHGKPRCIMHKRLGQKTAITSEVFHYKHVGGELVNKVNCLVPGPGNIGLVKVERDAGVETDITIDSRRKKEFTSNFALNGNINISPFFGFPLPIPLVFPWYGEYEDRFNSATATKITQRYGILDHIDMYNEGALTTVTNELFDYQTGDPVVTSVNNEYHDKVYNVTIPASWCWDGMSAAYNNINFEYDAPVVKIDSNHIGRIALAYGNVLHVGDEFEVTFKDHTNTTRTTRLWLLGGAGYVDGDGGSIYDTTYIAGKGTIDTAAPYFGDMDGSCVGYFIPRFPLNTPGWDTGTIGTSLHLRVVRSGARNMLTQEAQTITTRQYPIHNDGFSFRTSHNDVINISARTYSDSNTRIPYNFIANPDTINPFVIGERGIYNVLDEYAYVADRDYTGPVMRNAGLFDATGLYHYNGTGGTCVRFPYKLLKYDTIDAHWRKARTITKWSPSGKEIENLDAIGNYSTAVFRYNDDLPVAVASNAMNRDILAENFEDYNMLKPINSLTRVYQSPFELLFGTTSYAPAYKRTNTSSSAGWVITEDAAHTGKSSLLNMTTGGGYADANTVVLPLYDGYASIDNHYNFYMSAINPMTPAHEYEPFKLVRGKKYIASFWIKELVPTTPDQTTYALSSNWGVKVLGVTYPAKRKSNIIDGWQQLEVAFVAPLFGTTAFGLPFSELVLPTGYFIDDVRIFPADANMKAFVYHPYNEKLMATLDENNFAVMYEYDQEGNLVRKKKETERGIITISESRSSNPIQ